MAEKSFTLEIVTPEKSVFTGEVDSIIAPGEKGYFQILHNHTPYLSTLQIGMINVREGGNETLYALSGGFTQVSNNKVTVLAETAELAGDIDLIRAKEAQRRAESRLVSKEDDMDYERARLALFRAINRIRIAARN
jgi:F-type H+-transporting ATPase subunit epsilon